MKVVTGQKNWVSGSSDVDAEGPFGRSDLTFFVTRSQSGRLVTFPGSLPERRLASHAGRSVLVPPLRGISTALGEVRGRPSERDVR